MEEGFSGEDEAREWRFEVDDRKMQEKMESVVSKIKWDLLADMAFGVLETKSGRYA